jgi:hypothetical protein
LSCVCWVWFDLICASSLRRQVRARGLTGSLECSSVVVMEIGTLGVARSLGWKVHMRCANGYRDSTRSMRRCVYRQQLDLDAGCGARAKLPAITARVAPHVSSLWKPDGDGGVSRRAIERSAADDAEAYPLVLNQRPSVCF